MFNIVEKRRWFFLLSALVIVPGLVIMIYSTLTTGGPFRLSIDFLGGSIYELKFEDAGATEDNIRGIFSAVGDDNLSPNRFALNQNYPNPFNPSTKISFNLEKAGYTTLTIHNVLGQEVATVVAGDMSVGHHEVSFNALDLSSGVYFYKLQSGDFTSVKKMTLMR